MSRQERWLYWLVAAIGLVACVAYGAALAEPLRLNPTGCQFYAKDANHIALLRDSGSTEAATLEYYEGHKYDASVKPHLLALVRYVYASPLTPNQLAESLLSQCIADEGWIGRDT